MALQEKLLDQEGLEGSQLTYTTYSRGWDVSVDTTVNFI